MSGVRTAITVGVAICFVACFVVMFFKRFATASFWVFEGATSKETGVGVRATMKVDTKIKAVSFGDGSVGKKGKSTMPYDLILGFYTDTATAPVQSAIVKSVTVQFEDGKKVELIEPGREMVWPFAKRNGSNWDGKNIVYHESLVSGGTLTNRINRNVAFDVWCRGVVVEDAGKSNLFSINWHFRPKILRGVLPGYYLDPEVTDSDFPKP